MNFIFIRHVYLQEKIDVLEKTAYGYYSVTLRSLNIGKLFRRRENHTGLADRTSVHTQNGCSGAISATERICVAPISKVERHLWDGFCAILWCSGNTYSARGGGKGGVRPGSHWGLQFSAPNPLGKPQARCWMYVNDLCRLGPLLFIRYWYDTRLYNK